MFNLQDLYIFQNSSQAMNIIIVMLCLLTSERKQFGPLLDTMNKSKLNVPYEILEKATNYFNDANKLGQGGSGSVYKVYPDLMSYFPFGQPHLLLNVYRFCISLI